VELQPDYSPDGKRIAYTHVDGPPGYDAEIYTIHISGRGKLKLTDNEKDEEEPSYSPNGKSIAYTGWKAYMESDGDLFDSALYTINVGGWGEVQVFATKGNAGWSFDPSWGSRP
jgi:Tol biopolymer transport system component